MKMWNRELAVVYSMLVELESEVTTAPRLQGGTFFFDTNAHRIDPVDTLSDDRRAVLTGNGFERLPDGRWAHEGTGKIISRKAAEQNDSRALRVLIALALLDEVPTLSSEPVRRHDANAQQILDAMGITPRAPGELA